MHVPCHISAAPDQTGPIHRRLRLRRSINRAAPEQGSRPETNVSPRRGRTAQPHGTAAARTCGRLHEPRSLRTTLAQAHALWRAVHGPGYYRPRHRPSVAVRGVGDGTRSFGFRRTGLRRKGSTIPTSALFGRKHTFHCDGISNQRAPFYRSKKRLARASANSIITLPRAPRMPLVPHPCPFEGHETDTSGHQRSS